MKKIAQSFLALAAIVVLSTVARAVWDSTLGNMPNSYQLCWGLNSNACIYGSTVSNFVRIQTGGTDALTINSSQQVAIPGALSVTGNQTVAGTLTVTGLTTVSGNETVVGQSGLLVQTTTQLATLTPYTTGALVIVQFDSAGVPAAIYGTCISSGIGGGAWVYPSTSTTSGARACN